MSRTNFKKIELTVCMWSRQTNKKLNFKLIKKTTAQFSAKSPHSHAHSVLLHVQKSMRFTELPDCVAGRRQTEKCYRSHGAVRHKHSALRCMLQDD